MVHRHRPSENAEGPSIAHDSPAADRTTGNGSSGDAQAARKSGGDARKVRNVPVRDPNDLGDWLARVVYPALYQRLDAAFPEFGWGKSGDSWLASKWPAGFPLEVSTGERPDRLQVYADRPWWVKVHGRDGVRWLHYVSGERSPRGQKYLDACRSLGKLAGVPFPERERTAEQIAADQRRDERRAFLEAMTSLCEEVLWSPEGRQARDYLIEKRQLAEDEIRGLRLGLYLAGKAWAPLRAAGWADGQIKEHKFGWAKMAGYVTFHWLDEHGRMLTVYGRWPGSPPLMRDTPAWATRRDELATGWERGDRKANWQEPCVPKTYALPGSSSKSSPVYLDRVLRAGHREVVIVEGVFDAATLQACGETRAVATVAVQLSGEQLKALRRCRVERAYVCGDPDGGGDAGTVRNVVALAHHGVTPAVLPRLPEGTDPDEYVIAHGADAWRELVLRSRHGYHHLAEDLIRRHGPRGDGDDFWADDLVKKAGKLAAELPQDRPDEIARHLMPPIAEATGSALDDLRKRLGPGRSTEATGPRQPRPGISRRTRPAPRPVAGATAVWPRGRPCRPGDRSSTRPPSWPRETSAPDGSSRARS
jgi:hypothetical protein